MKLSSKKRKTAAAVCAFLSIFGCAAAANVYLPAHVEAAGYTVQEKNPVSVMPINQAKFLKGQRFDLQVEVKGLADDFKVTVDGVDAEKYFGKKGEVKTADGVTVYCIPDVAFTKAGAVKVEAVSGGNNDLLNMEKMPHMAVITTSGYDSLVTDSANSASAYATGHKSVNNAMGVYANSTKDPFDDPKVENIIELVKRTKGMATGIVSTSNITDATPAAMLSHTRRRAEQNFIAETMTEDYHRPDVIMGGGSRHFIPMNVPGSKRKDNVNVVEQFKDLGYTFSGNRTELLNTPADEDKILGLYQLDNMNVYIDRAMLKNPKVLGGFNDQPGLVEMTQRAIDTLSKNENGFFLMVEGACVDKQLHVMDWQRAAYDNIELDQAVGVAKKFAAENGNDTLIIVVADHAHGASITGTYHELDGKTGREAVRTYAAAGWPTFEDRDGDGYPDNPNPDVTLAVQFANHPDTNINYKFKEVPTSPAIMAGDKAIANPKLEGEFYKGNIPYKESQEVHSADDILLNAMGPGSEYFNGVMDNTEVFFGMVRALGLDGTKNYKK